MTRGFLKEAKAAHHQLFPLFDTRKYFAVEKKVWPMYKYSMRFLLSEEEEEKRDNQNFFLPLLENKSLFFARDFNLGEKIPDKEKGGS